MYKIKIRANKICLKINNKVINIDYYFNKSHQQNVYFDIKKLDASLIPNKELFLDISSKFNKPLQIFSSSKDILLNNKIVESGFVLKRKCYLCHFKIDELKPASIDVAPLKEINSKKDTDYLKIAKLLFDKYKIDHQEINPLTSLFKEFVKYLPKRIIYLNIDEDFSYAFLEEDIAYVGSTNISLFKRFADNLLIFLFKEFLIISFESDDTDKEAMILKSCFKDKELETINTYIFK